MMRARTYWMFESVSAALIDHGHVAEGGLGVVTDPALRGAHHDRTVPAVVRRDAGQ
jgi:hypothetical protein